MTIEAIWGWCRERQSWLVLGVGGVVLVLPFSTLLPLYQWPPGIAASHSPLIVWHLVAMLGLAG